MVVAITEEGIMEEVSLEVVEEGVEAVEVRYEWYGDIG
jgi:hypothetical protein